MVLSFLSNIPQRSKAYPAITYKCVVGKSLVKSKNPNTNKAISLKEL